MCTQTFCYYRCGCKWIADVYKCAEKADPVVEDSDEDTIKVARKKTQKKQPAAMIDDSDEDTIKVAPKNPQKKQPAVIIDESDEDTTKVKPRKKRSAITASQKEEDTIKVAPKTQKKRFVNDISQEEDTIKVAPKTQKKRPAKDISKDDEIVTDPPSAGKEAKEDDTCNPITFERIHDFNYRCPRHITDKEQEALDMFTAKEENARQKLKRNWKMNHDSYEFY